jgi:hypothetical protein
MNHATMRALARLAARQYGLLTIQQAYEAGLTKRQVSDMTSSGQWEYATRGVYRVAAAPEQPRQQLLAHLLAAGPGAVASHRAAASLWQLPGFGPRIVEISKPRGRSQRIGHGRIHGSLWLPDHHITSMNGIPVTKPARTLFDLAGWLHRDQVKRAFRNAINADLVTPEQQAALVAELGKRGRRGTALMRQLCEAHGVGPVASATELEALLLDVLQAAGLPAPDPQVDLGDSEGWIGRVDFYYRNARVVIEADSRRWHDPDDDRVRDNRLAAAGWRVIRITWEQLVNRPWEVVALVRDAIRAAA